MPINLYLGLPPAGTPLPVVVEGLVAELVAHPERARALPPEVARELLAQLAPLQTLLLAQALQPLAGGNGQPEPSAEGDRFLTPEEVARLLGVTPAWVYRHAKRLPFTRKLSRKCLRFSEAGLRRWQAAKRA